LQREQVDGYFILTSGGEYGVFPVLEAVSALQPDSRSRSISAGNLAAGSRCASGWRKVWTAPLSAGIQILTLTIDARFSKLIPKTTLGA
jgi:hypothetical protein